MLVNNAYRISSHVAKKYRTLKNNCSDLVDEAWMALEDEFGEEQPILSSYVVGKKEFQKLQEQDMVNTITEFTILYRSNRTRCTETCSFLFYWKNSFLSFIYLFFLLFIFVKLHFILVQFHPDIDVTVHRCPFLRIPVFQPCSNGIIITDIDVRTRRCWYGNEHN